VVIPYGDAWLFVSDLLMVLILVSGVFAVAEHRKSAAVLALLSALLMGVALLEWVLPAGKNPSLRDLLALGAIVVLAFAVGINVFASGHAIGDRVFGAVVLYLLLGLMWAVAYHIVDAHSAAAFTEHANAGAGLVNWTYFSFVTLTTVGYGDITPVSQGARTLAMLEALVGQLYPAVIIARLVSLQSSAR
jgi:hypothetical protein